MRQRSSLNSSLWWSALFVLLINDHFLKSTSLHWWITGKLSDFAGLIVAPILMAELARLAGQRRATQHALFFLPVVVFSAINLSPAMAGGWSSLMHHVGVSWFTEVDATDLIALLVLPLSYRHQFYHRANVSSLAGIRLPAPAILVGSLACIATSPPPDGPFTANYGITNQSLDQVILRVRRLSAEVDCDAVSEIAATDLRAEDFDDGETWRLEPGEVARLDREFGQQCHALLLSADSLPPVIVYFPEDAERFEVELPVAANASAAGLLKVVGDAADLTVEETAAGPSIRPLVASADTCELSTPFEWSGVRSGLVRSRDYSASCHVLELVQSSAEYLANCQDPDAEGCADKLSALNLLGYSFVCIPESIVPAEVGQQLDVAASSGPCTELRAGGNLLELCRGEELPRMPLQEHPNASVCYGRDAWCGGYRREFALYVGDKRLVPWQSTTSSEGGTQYTYTLGHASARTVGGNSCGLELGKEISIARLSQETK